jgi:hypothetical protein
MQNFIVMNPNVDKDVKSTDNLNRLSKALRTHNFMSRIKSEGFELSICDFKWEYIITFKSTTGFIVFRENSNDKLDCWLYKFDDDLQPQQFLIDSADKDSGEVFIKLVKSMYYSIIK